MRRPEVTVENYENVYEFYGQHKPGQLALRSLHLLAGTAYHPSVHYAEGAESRVSFLLNSNHRLVMSCNHINMLDQFPVAAALSKEKALKPIVGRTVALAKQPYFEKPYRPILDALGAIPVYRRTEMGNNPTVQLNVTKALIKTFADKIQDGYHVFAFPEGTRNRGNRTQLGKIHRGLGRIALQAAETVPVAILPMALWYGDDKKHAFEPVLYINNPIEGPFESDRQITSDLSESMAHSLQLAREYSNRDRY